MKSKKTTRTLWADWWSCWSRWWRASPSVRLMPTTTGSRLCSSPTSRARSDPGNHQVQGYENRDDHHQGVDHPPDPNRLDRNHEDGGYTKAEAEQDLQGGPQCWLATCHANVRSQSQPPRGHCQHRAPEAESPLLSWLQTRCIDQAQTFANTDSTANSPSA